MKKNLFLLFIIIFLGLIASKKDVVISFIARNFLFKTEEVEIINNEYYKNQNYMLVQNTNNTAPVDKKEFANILYTILNSGKKEFSFYCAYEYTNCADDFNDFIANSKEVETINNYVSPLNSFNNISVSTTNFNKITISIEKVYTEEQQLMVSNKIDDFIKNNIKSTMTDTDKIKIFHDYIINNTKYDKNFDLKTDRKSYKKYPYNAYGVLFEGYGICSGYSDAMAIYLDKLGIKNYRISSDEHVWNYVYVNNNWYHLDLTWDDPVTDIKKDMLIYDFFLITNEQLEKLNTNQHYYDLDLYPEAK